MNETFKIAVIGGGAAGFFAAVRAAEVNPAARVVIFEATAHVLAKVRISGGGRCNTTHACFEARELVKRYPRGSRELIGPFNRFGPRDTVAWFAARGVELKTEADGRMFPVTDDSSTIVDCLRRAASSAAVEVRVRTPVEAVEVEGGEAGGMSGVKPDPQGASGGFRLVLRDGVERFDRVILAAGGGKAGGGHALAEGLGHTIETLAPSLFTFQIEDAVLRGLEGLAVPEAEVSVPGTKLKERGPVLVTHWGLSGPGILRLSAWGARELAACDYQFTVRVAWTGEANEEKVRAAIAAGRESLARKQLTTANPLGLPGRLWDRLVEAAGVPATTVWNALPKKGLSALVRAVAASEFAVTGKSMNKEEFVTCGGVRLKEVNFKTMESRRCPGLYFAGEVLDIDGITGGFNFQNAWTTGWIAGSAAAEVIPAE
ncbi:aminoacetone oxidase family FAD-binding enzyme [Actomonas aquatica]|uniref:Aminoacetone oxidase family FAD-binding enzyme n=1 Tax=Actomonas aquatica TaxID=2866162 RepID=A0ABZ1C4Z4_9BACT|nr:aminoacetone oxidase family FAD-binding enzyme [Opitutus sp. WL0086]WRQ86403.1 aminoacetone oxidase family FAD-binding enzyme [Opitutus sp. WL0086]